MSQTAQPDFANADVGDVLDEQREQHREDKREQARQSSLRRKIEQRRENKTIHIRVEGAKVPFSPPGGEVDEVQDIVHDFAGKDEDELTQEEHNRAQKFRDRIPVVLGEKCQDETMDAAFWKKEFAPEERQIVLGKLARGGEEGRDADGFRSK